MAANQVDSVAEASILPVLVPLAVQPTIFPVYQYLHVSIHGWDHLERVCTGT
jgi:hypothetical protein